MRVWSLATRSLFLRVLAKVLIVDEEAACGVGLVRLACLQGIERGERILGTTSGGGAVAFEGFPDWLSANVEANA